MIPDWIKSYPNDWDEGVLTAEWVSEAMEKTDAGRLRKDCRKITPYEGEVGPEDG